tara:strand:+ start:78 stop:299 length:222 start_codon:yes stop_codon:yes gene_type:complete
MKKCPMCKKVKHNSEYNKGGAANNTYCRLCQRVFNNNKTSKIKHKILKATNNGKCWWVYQSIMADRIAWQQKK